MLRRWFFFWLGLGVLFANKIRYAIRGYRTPRNFSVNDISRAIAYDREVVAKWEKAGAVWPGKSILELGPGADLGVGLLLLAKGAAWYQAVDVNPLVARAPDELYETLITTLDAEAQNFVRRALDDHREGRHGALRYIHDPKFRFESIADASIDLVVSNAAFEHFDNVEQVLRDATRVLKPGGMLCAVVDLQTHTRVLRDRDPLNIYRYPSWLYRLAYFRGIPNRVLPDTYVAILKKLGWTDIQIVPEQSLSPRILARDCGALAKRFRSSDGRMGILSFFLTARR